jgi:hypothetical protein
MRPPLLYGNESLDENGVPVIPTNSAAEEETPKPSDCIVRIQESDLLTP